MKVQKLGLPTGKGIVYLVTPDGRVVKTEKQKASTVTKVKLTQTDDFWYVIDDEGDLAREYKDVPKRAERSVPTHPTQPPSAKLGAKDLLKRIDKLLFPPVRDCLGYSGHVFTNTETTRKAYDKEFARVNAELAYALGPGQDVVDAQGRTGVVYPWRGRFVLLAYEWHPIETPFASIDLEWVDEDAIARFTPRTTKPGKKKRASR